MTIDKSVSGGPSGGVASPSGAGGEDGGPPAPRLRGTGAPIEFRGRVSMAPDVGRQFDTQLSWKYDGKDPGQDRPGAVRVVVRMVVEKAAGYAA